jgi:hypothetical protein
LLLTTVLGLTPGPEGPGIDPHLREGLTRVVLRDVPGRWGRADVDSRARVS